MAGPRAEEARERQVLYDTNVLLDVLLHREPHFRQSAAVLDLVSQGKAAGCVAGHAVPTLWYLLRREVGAEESLERLSRLLGRVTVAAVSDGAVRSALAAGFGDFEDAVTHAAAVEAGADLIVTRNAADFAAATLPVLPPAPARAWLLQAAEEVPGSGTGGDDAGSRKTARADTADDPD